MLLERVLVQYHSHASPHVVVAKVFLLICDPLVVMLSNHRERAILTINAYIEHTLVSVFDSVWREQTCLTWLSVSTRYLSEARMRSSSPLIGSRPVEK